MDYIGVRYMYIPQLINSLPLNAIFIRWFDQMRQTDKPLELYYVVHKYVLSLAPPGWLSWNHSYLIVKKLFYIWNKYMYMYKGTLYCNYKSLNFLLIPFLNVP